MTEKEQTAREAELARRKPLWQLVKLSWNRSRLSSKPPVQRLRRAAKRSSTTMTPISSTRKRSSTISSR